VRPFTEGTVTGGSLAAVSFPTPDAEVDAIAGRIGAASTATGTTVEVEEATCPSVEMDSPPGEGRESLVAAQASAVARVSERSMGIEDLWVAYCISSMEELLIRGDSGSVCLLIHFPGPRRFRSAGTPSRRDCPHPWTPGNPSCFRDMFGIF